jgi:hypothetical protein
VGTRFTFKNGFGVSKTHLSRTPFARDFSVRRQAACQDCLSPADAFPVLVKLREKLHLRERVSGNFSQSGHTPIAQSALLMGDSGDRKVIKRPRTSRLFLLIRQPLRGALLNIEAPLVVPFHHLDTGVA